MDQYQKGKEGNYIGRERYAGYMQRSFYVGDIPSGDVHAKYEDGILKLSVPKADVKRLESHNAIAIE